MIFIVFSGKIGLDMIYMKIQVLFSLIIFIINRMTSAMVKESSDYSFVCDIHVYVSPLNAVEEEL